MATTTSHPNLKLHDELIRAAKDGKLDADFIKKAVGLAHLPTVDRDASAYVNWSTTVSMLGHAPARLWFSGVSRAPGNSGFQQSQDFLRDDLSVGVEYWVWSFETPPKNAYFWVEYIPSINLLFIDVFDGLEFVAAFVGTGTMNCQIQGRAMFFEGDGVLSFSK